jgi:hypothetical protein
MIQNASKFNNLEVHRELKSKPSSKSHKKAQKAQRSPK